jgi:hypothetical protein
MPLVLTEITQFIAAVLAAYRETIYITPRLRCSGVLTDPLLFPARPLQSHHGIFWFQVDYNAVASHKVGDPEY